MSRLDAPAAAPAGNPSCCSACRVIFKRVQFCSAIFRRSLTSRESVGRLPVDGGVAVVLGGPGQENTLAISCLSNDRCDILFQLN